MASQSRAVRTLRVAVVFFFFFNDTATTEIYTLSLHDALPICPVAQGGELVVRPMMTLTLTCDHRTVDGADGARFLTDVKADRKSTRLNSSHANISYAVFCLKKKKRHRTTANLRLQAAMIIVAM